MSRIEDADKSRITQAEKDAFLGYDAAMSQQLSASDMYRVRAMVTPTFNAIFPILSASLIGCDKPKTAFCAVLAMVLKGAELAIEDGK